jgi:phosphoglycolate phosphatase
MKKYKVVLFDLDGTLLDTLDDLGAAVNSALSKRGLPLHDRASYQMKVGHGIRDLVTKSLPEEMRGDTVFIDECLADFKAYYTTHIDIHTRPYPGMPELLLKLHQNGVALAVASNKFQEGTEHLVREFFPDVPFVAILGNRPGAPLKPDPRIVQEVLRAAGVAPEEAVLVGDSGTDMQTAANGGIDRIAVNWGYRPMEGSPGIRVVDSARELAAILL